MSQQDSDTNDTTTRDFEPFLARLEKSLRTRGGERETISSELRDHLIERTSDLVSQGMAEAEAAETALAEFGDAAELAAEFDAVTWTMRRRWMMRCTTGSLVAAVAVMLLAMTFWPDAATGPGVSRTIAQEKGTVPSKADAARSREENNRRIEQWLASTRVKADFEEKPFDQLRELLRTLGEKQAEAGKPPIQIHVNRRALEDAGIDDSVKVDVHLADVRLDMLMDMVLEQLGMGYYIDDGIIFFTAKDHLDSRLEVRVYNCQDLLDLPRLNKRVAPSGGNGPRGGFGPGLPGAGGGPPGGEGAPGAGGEGLGPPGGDPFGGPMPPPGPADELIELIQNFVDPDGWQEVGGPGTITEYRGMLVVAVTAEAHRDLERLLQKLREAVGNKPAAKMKGGGKEIGNSEGR